MSKTIEFTLPQGAGGQAALHYSHRIKNALQDWAWQQHKPQIKWITLQYKLIAEFACEQDLILFVLTWQDDTLPVYTIITSD